MPNHCELGGCSVPPYQRPLNPTLIRPPRSPLGTSVATTIRSYSNPVMLFQLASTLSVLSLITTSMGLYYIDDTDPIIKVEFHSSMREQLLLILEDSLV